MAFDIQVLKKGLLSRNLYLIENLLPLIKAPTDEVTNEIVNNDELKDLLFAHWQWDESGDSEDPICSWFYAWYQTDLQVLQNFVLTFLPDMTWIFLFKYSHGITLIGIQSIFITIYNCEAVMQNGEDSYFCCPPITQPQQNIKSQKTNFLSEVALQAHTQEKDHRKIKTPGLRPIGLSKDIELSSTLMLDTITVSFRHFGRRLNDFSKYTHRSFVTMLSLLTSTGYGETEESKVDFLTLSKSNEETFAMIEKKIKVSNKYGSVRGKQSSVNRAISQFDGDKKSYEKRCIYLPVHLQMQFLQIVGYLIYADRVKRQALKVLYVIQARAEIELSNEILLITNALLHKSSLDRIKL